MTTTKILLFSGSTRTESLNNKLTKLAAAELTALGAEVSHISLADYPLPLYNGDEEAADGIPENARRLKALFRDHHGIFIGCPEYNASLTPLLKNTIDWVTRVHDETRAITAFRDRVFAIGCAAGGFGGLRASMALRQILEIGLGATVIPEQVLIRSAMNAFDENGQFLDDGNTEKVRSTCQRLFAEATRYANEA